MHAPPTTVESPWPVRVVNTKIKEWIERLGHVWVEGQITQVNQKPTWRFSYLTLRDVEEEVSVQVTCPTGMLEALESRLQPGDRVVCYGKPSFYKNRGNFSLWVTQVQRVGIGELLARIERLKSKLQSEGLFDASRKRSLPFLPKTVGLITGRGSHAERDVLSVAQARWPAVNFRTINTAVQGSRTVPEVVHALHILDADPTVEVIIIARGGGSVEDLLPFSEEQLQHAVAECRTPVVSAIGHDPDNPVLDYVADVRAATPTDAAKRVVPDVVEELAQLTTLRQRLGNALRGWVEHQEDRLAQERNRPVLAQPLLPIVQRENDLVTVVERLRGTIIGLLRTATSDTASLRARVGSLGPAATLARGYAVVQVTPRDHSDPEVVTSIEQSPPGSQLRIRVGDGTITAAAMAVTPKD